MRRCLLAGAEKVSINSAAVPRRTSSACGAEAFGSQVHRAGMTFKRVEPRAEIPSGYEVVITAADAHGITSARMGAAR